MHGRADYSGVRQTSHTDSSRLPERNFNRLIENRRIVMRPMRQQARPASCTTVAATPRIHDQHITNFTFD
jgi:hypothetical protein